VVGSLFAEIFDPNRAFGRKCGMGNEIKIAYEVANSQVWSTVAMALNAQLTTNETKKGDNERMALAEEDSPATRSDNDLLLSIAATQSREAFSVLFQRLGPRVKAYMMKLGASPDIAEEITQETFVSVWRKAQQFDQRKSSAVTWIFTIARNQRIDRLRKERRPALDPNDPLLVPNKIPTPFEELEQSSIVKTVTASIEQLPDDQRDVVRLSFIEGLSHQEISARLKTPLGTIKSRLRLSFEKLRLSLGDFQ
jgi:RNA polymerase sigma-70 factor (ECF subfamily)